MSTPICFFHVFFFPIFCHKFALSLRCFHSFPLRHPSRLGSLLDRGRLPGEPRARARAAGLAGGAAAGGTRSSDAPPGRAGEQDGDLVAWIQGWGVTPAGW